MKPQEVKQTTSHVSKRTSGQCSQSDDHGHEKGNKPQHTRAQQATPNTHRRTREPRAQKQERQEENTANNQARVTFSHAIERYLDDHRGGNHSSKTIEWHETALGLLQGYLQQKRGIIQVPDVDAPAISGWFSHLRQIPGARGKLRTERTIQTYARSARAFFHWLVRQELITEHPFERLVFPKVGKPLIQTITEEEFEQLLRACALPNEGGRFAERATARNRAILWVLYDTGVRVSELITLRVGDLDRKHGLITVKGKGAKERRIALGQNCLRSLLHYLDRHRPDEQELAAWGCSGDDRLLLSETRQPLTKNGMTLLFARFKKRAGITGKRISPHIFRHTFAIRFLILGNDPFSLQELLGHEDMTTVKNYMHMNKAPYLNTS